jgi:hypothetical protein
LAVGGRQLAVGGRQLAVGGRQLAVEKALCFALYALRFTLLKNYHDKKLYQNRI